MSQKDSSITSKLKIQGETVLDLLKDEEENLDGMYNNLATYATSEKIPDDFRDEVLAEIQDLNEIERDFKKAHIKSLEMKDELESRYKDVEKSINKKWYKANPPSNTEIDYKEKESNHFAKGINFYKSSLVLFAGSLAGVLIELLWCLLTKRYVQSRSGLVYGPFQKALKNDKFSSAIVWSGIAALLGVGVRYFVHYIAGVLFWGQYAPEGTSPWVYSLSVNGTAGAGTFLVVMVACILLIRQKKIWIAK